MPADVQMTGTGLLRWTPGRERYRVPGGGAIALALAPGDRLAVVDVEGRQRCELGVFGPDGNADPSRLGLRADGAMEGFAAALRRGDESAQAADAALRRRGVDLAPRQSGAGLRRRNGSRRRSVFPRRRRRRLPDCGAGGADEGGCPGPSHGPRRGGQAFAR